MVLVYAAMLGLAWLIHRMVERPVAPLLRSKLSEAVLRVVATGQRAAPALARAPAAGPASGTAIGVR